MYKKLFLLVFIFISTLSADKLFNKIENLIGTKDYLLHYSLLHVLFKNEAEFYITNEILHLKSILKTLKENGLLSLKFKKPQEIQIEFNSNTDAIKTLKILNETLRGVGYYYYFTKSSSFNSSTNALKWVISFSAEYMLDPSVLVQELQDRSCRVTDIVKHNSKYWSYTIDMDFARIKEAIKVDNNERVILQKPLRPYFLEVTNATTIRIIGRTLNHWFPYIAFYDKHLNVLDLRKHKTLYKNYNTTVPRGTKYIKITDLYTLLNIKRGLSIIVK